MKEIVCSDIETQFKEMSALLAVLRRREMILPADMNPKDYELLYHGNPQRLEREVEKLNRTGHVLCIHFLIASGVDEDGNEFGMHYALLKKPQRD